MRKRVFIIHGWDGYLEECWFPWLTKNLTAKGFEVFMPQLPNPEHPRIHTWVPKIAEVVGSPDENTYFVGHSMGCQAIIRYLETLPHTTKIGGAVFVGGFLTRLTGLEEEIKEDPDVAETEKHWLNAPINFEKVKRHLPKSVAIFSDNDYYVPLDNQDTFRDKLGSYIVIEHGMGHFCDDDGVTELHSALEAVLDITEDKKR